MQLKKLERTFLCVLIKPSHYDDDGYVIRWWRTIVPSNSLAALYGIAADSAERQVLGSDVAIEIDAMDETNTRIDTAALIERFRANGNFGMVGLVGVQSNQYPRALDIARPLRAAGIPVVIGGFHVSGCLSMLDKDAVGLDACRDMGVSMFAGEAEDGRLDLIFRDAAAGTLAPLYNFMKDLPGMEGAPVPFLPISNLQRAWGNSTSFDAGRGCPYQCSFCTIINVQGRKSRYRTADDVEKLVRLNWAQGVAKFFITDDNFARNKEWESIFDRLIELRAQGIPIGLMIQVDTLCHKIPNFVEKSKLAGVTRVFIGLENINPENLATANKRQNKITEYRKMLLAWKAQGIITLAGYILGFPSDTPETIRRDIEIIKRELPLDGLEFFNLTPLPGSEDHQSLWRRGVPMDPDLNKYDLEHVCADHPRMTRKEWADIYQEAWSLYYTPEHMKTLLRRAAATGVSLRSLIRVLVTFATSVSLEGVHPIQYGVFRLKHRDERRAGLRRESALVFWPRFAWECVTKITAALSLNVKLMLVARAIERDPAAKAYMDQALTPVCDDDDVTLDLLTKTTGAAAAVAHIKKVAVLTRPAKVAV